MYCCAKCDSSCHHHHHGRWLRLPQATVLWLQWPVTETAAVRPCFCCCCRCGAPPAAAVVSVTGLSLLQSPGRQNSRAAVPLCTTLLRSNPLVHCLLGPCFLPRLLASQAA